MNLILKIKRAVVVLKTIHFNKKGAFRCIFYLIMQPLEAINSLLLQTQTKLSMKKSILFLLLLIGGSFSLFAQTTTTSDLKPAEGTWGFTGGVTGFSNVSLTGSNTGTLGFRYILANGLVARVSAILSTGHSKVDSTGHTFGNGNSNSGIEFTDTRNTPSTVGISLGISKSWAGTDRLDPYVGADIRISNAGGGKTISRQQVNNADSAVSWSGTPHNGDYVQVTNKSASGISIGIVPCVGFNYFVAKHFAFGAEFGWGFFFTHLSGGSSVSESSVNGTVNTVTTDYTAKNNSNGFGTTGVATVSFTVFY